MAGKNNKRSAKQNIMNNENPAYEKITQHTKNWGLEEKQLQELQKMTWVVSEKIHGANFSFVFEGHQLFFAKRKAYLQWKDDFFGFQEVVRQLEEKLMLFFEQLSLHYTAKQYILYGELCGGAYPHPEVVPNEKVQAIQTGIYYHPDILFFAFDVALVQENGQKTYLDHPTMIEWLNAFQLRHAPVLKVGKWQEVLSFDTRIDSALPALLGLPALPQNLIEGIVVKPWIHSTAKTLTFRPILKIKNVEFEEEEKFHQAEKWTAHTTNFPNSFSESLAPFVETLTNAANTNRLQSAVSKVGAPNPYDSQRMEAIRTEMRNDILQDFEENFPQWIGSLSSKEQQWILDRLNAKINWLLHTI
ncbi:MAG: 2'-5' RNA ligase [Cytophagales bacterium]|nr:MAG: 2'-5' RNA ligase [Cytophagales bacterium]